MRKPVVMTKAVCTSRAISILRRMVIFHDRPIVGARGAILEALIREVNKFEIATTLTVRLSKERD